MSASSEGGEGELRVSFDEGVDVEGGAPGDRVPLSGVWRPIDIMADADKLILSDDDRDNGIGR